MGLRYITGDITQVEVDAIVNAANARGYMGGWLGRYVKLRGVAESIHYATAGKVEREAKRVARAERPQLGDVYVTGGYNLPARWVLHAVTMLKPGSRSSLATVERCVGNVLATCHRLGVQSVAVPLLGTGTGRLNVKEVEAVYADKFGQVDRVDVVVVRPFRT